MLRYARVALIAAVIVGSIVAALCSFRIAGAVPLPPFGPIVHPAIPPRPVESSFPTVRRIGIPVSSPSAEATPSGPVLRNWVHDAHPPKQPLIGAPKISQFLVKSGKHTFSVRQVHLMSPMISGRHMRSYSANGNTIILTGDQDNYFNNDITLAYGADVYAACVNMTRNHNYTFYIYPPDGSGARTIGATTNGAGTCNGYANFNLSTPWTGNGAGTTVGTDGAYPGVWIMALRDNSSGQFVTETAIIANASINFTTYANLGLTAAAYDFTPGSTIVVNATGLNPNQYYNIGFVLTAGSNLPCEYAIPQGSNNSANAVCFTGAPTGLQAFGGGLTQYWGAASSPSTNAAPTGTYDVELYDTTTGEMIGHQQMSIEPSTVAWTLTPVNSTGATPPPGFNYNNIFATDGLTDQSVTGLTYAATGLPGASNGHTERVVVSDPNGVALTQASAYLTLAAPATATQAGGAITSTQAFPLQQTLEQAFGPTQTPFAPNVFTVQLYDNTLGTVLGSKSFQILGYASTLAWSSGAVLSAGPTGATGTLTLTNTGGSSFGSWNGDVVSGVQLSTVTANGESLGLSSTTAIDSGGNPWTITSTGVGVNTVITATPNQRNTGIPVGGTLTFNVTVTIPAGKCTTPCDVNTQILPEHGIAFSGNDTATNAVEVLASGINPSTVIPTLTWSVQSESTTANMAARASLFDKLTYILGTANSGTADYYTVDMTVNNVVSAGGNRFVEAQLTFPAAIDLNAGGSTPIMVSAPAGTGTWEVCSNTYCFNIGTNTATNGRASPIPSAGQNVIAIACRETAANGCGIAEGSSGTFVMEFPLFKTSFIETAIPMLANFAKGNAYGTCGACNMASYSVGASQTVVDGIAGISAIASNELAAFSLNPTLMTMQFTPSTVGTGSGSGSTTLVYTNAPSSQDPNPDYVDALKLTFPAGTDPSSITPPAGWYAYETAANSRIWIVATCAKGSGLPTNATPCSNPEANFVAPGAQLSMGVAWTTNPTAGTYNVTWSVTGANGGEDTSSLNQTTPITFSPTTASVGFSAINGAAVTSGSEPQVGTDTILTGSPWSDKGSVYQLTVNNTGSTVLNKIVITVPHLTRAGVAGSDGKTKNPSAAGYYYVTSATAGSGGCGAATIVQPTAAADGTITFSGCTIAANSSVVVTFDAQTPYLVGNEFTFSATVYQGATAFTATPTYAGANVVSVILNGTLTIVEPALGYVAPTSPNSIVPIDNTLIPSTSCVSCQVFAGAPDILDFGVFSGTFTSKDVIDASVMSDANNISSNSWVLYVTAYPGTNPSNMLSTDVDNTAGHSTSGMTISQSTLATVPNTSPGLQLSTYASTPYHGPMDSVMNYTVTTGGNTSPETVTLTYTLVFN